MSFRAQNPLYLLAAAALGALAVTQRGGPPASGQDVPAPIAAHPQRRTFWGTLVEIATRVGDDNLTLIAAGVAFYAFLALFPAAAALVAVFGLVADPRLVESQVVELSGLMPQSALDLLLGVVRGVAEKPPGQLGLAFAISTAVALWSARAGVTSLMSGLDIAYRNRQVRSFLASTAVGLALTLGSILVASALVVVIAGLPAVYAAAPAIFVRISGPLVQWVRWPAVALVMAISLAILYRVAPSRPPPHWRPFSSGTLVATALWLVTSSGFSLYVTWSGSYNATYGSLAGVVVLMLWLWASSLAVLVGATVDAVVAGHER